MLRIVRNAVAPALVLLSSVSASTGAQTASVSGRVTVIDRGDKVARDVGQAVVWLETGESAAVTPDTVQIAMSDKEFSPRVVVVPTGSTIGFPNNDPFNHNVFSLSPEGPFDLGLYGRREAKSTTLNQPGILRVYCNVHARMSAFAVVRDNPHFTQPAADGSFVLRDLPPGRYVLHAWHERAAEVQREIEVTASGTAGLDVELDARGFKETEHLNKYGRPYRRRGRRY